MEKIGEIEKIGEMEKIGEIGEIELLMYRTEKLIFNFPFSTFNFNY